MWDPVESAKSVKGLAIRKGVYEWNQMVGGKRYHESLRIPVGTKADETAAVKLLRSKQRAVTEGRIDDAQEFKRVGKTATLGEILDAHERFSVSAGLGPRTVRAYQSALLSMVATVTGAEDARKLSGDVLTAELVERYEHLTMRAAGSDPAAVSRARNTIASKRSNARAVFARRARNRMRNLVLPDSLDDFLRAGDVQGHIKWGLPDPGLVERTKAAALELRKDKPRLWLCWLLCYGLALRASEAAWARMSWLRVAPDGKTVLDVIKRPDEWDGPKGTEGFVVVPPKLLAELQELRGGETYILPGKVYWSRYRSLLQNDFTAWMRGLGWDGSHCAHELRRLRGSEWWTDAAVGPVVCSAWLRHSSLAVTQRHYAKLTQHPDAPEAF